MASVKRVSFLEFLNIGQLVSADDYSGYVKHSPASSWKISSQYGTGDITTIPLMGDAGLVVMDCYFNEDIEIYAEQAVQDNLSFTICLHGSLTSCGQGYPNIEVKEHETLFARQKNVQRQTSSYFEGGKRNCFITIQLGVEWLKSIEEGVLPDIITNPFWQGIYNSGRASQLMLTVAHEIAQEVSQQSRQYHYISAKVLELWSHELTLLRRLSVPENKSLTLKAQDVASIHQAAEILLKEMVNPPSLLELSRRVGINDNKLKKNFKQVLGTTAFAYLQQQRLKKAKTLIYEHDYNVLQAAVEVGFKSSSHFSKVFKQAFGMTPRELRS